MSRAHGDPCAALLARHVAAGGRWLAAGLELPFDATTWHRSAHGGRRATAFPPDGPFDGVAMRWPGDAVAGVALARSLALRLAPDGALVAVAPVDEGGKSIARRLADGFDDIQERYGNHARLVIARGQRDTFAADPQPTSFEVPGLGVFASWPGLFAHGRLDDGTQLLLANLPPMAGARVLDFGCGAGILSAAASVAGATSVVASDVDALAVHATAQNVAGARVVLADGVPDGGPWDVILSNPPLHTGRQTDGAMLEALAAAPVAPGGCVVFVTHPTVPVGRMFAGRIAERVAGARGYAVWSVSGAARGTAQRPGSPSPSGP